MARSKSVLDISNNMEIFRNLCNRIIDKFNIEWYKTDFKRFFTDLVEQSCLRGKNISLLYKRIEEEVLTIFVYMFFLSLSNLVLLPLYLRLTAKAQLKWLSF